MKIIGNKKERTALENLEVQEKLIAELKKNSPIQKKKGKIFKFRTWEEHYLFSLKRYVEHYE
ncbi:MAG: hypothetical protein H7A25_07175 [Leptospiraceae bacterium]|nr:hypothetical protein [Leptospiraceae bacterium]MCP5499665.1 hypothetical protein [Leptospiraceae bacterium]